MPSYPGVFQFGIFFIVALSESRRIFASGPLSISCNSFSMLFIHSGFFVIPFPFLHFSPKLFSFLYIQVFVCSRAFSTCFLVEFSFVISQCPFCLIPSRNLLSLPSFATSDFSPQVVLFDLPAVLFLFFLLTYSHVFSYT